MATLTALQSPKVAKPDHVPDELVYDLDIHYDAGILSDPHKRLQEVAETAPPIFWSPRGNGFWYINRHAFSFEAARDWESFSNMRIAPKLFAAYKAMMPAGEHMPLPVPIMLDPPDHAKYRQPLNLAFSPKAVMALKDEIYELAESLLLAVKPKGGCDFVTAVAEPLPVQVFLKLMGLPLDRQAKYREIVRRQLSSLGGSAAAGGANSIMREIADGMKDIILARRNEPQDDLISKLWTVQIEGVPVTLEDMENFGVLLFTAGLDTVMNAMGFGVRHLAMDPELQARLRAHPEQIPDATEELLRRYTFLFGTRRVGKDIVFHGVEMKENDALMLGLPNANIDPTRWNEPFRVNIDREDNAHLTFNAGPHRCVGSHLARIELQTMYERLLALLPPFRIAPNFTPTFHGGPVMGLDALELVWD